MSTTHTLQLTTQQQKVVAHKHGPALVFAVAGAGKTTAMVHRIERLVREAVFAPQHILATSFGVANIADLKAAMQPWSHCQSVDCRTLHSLGREILRSAQQMGYRSNMQLNSVDKAQSLLNRALATARAQNVAYQHELNGLDRQDFLDYVGSCKGNLAYANLNKTDLPSQALTLATQAEAPSETLSWYLDLYRLFESCRQQAGVITFDDMLMSGWEALITWPNLLEQVQQRYQCVLVDEFQDINLAQWAILDLITQPQRNYMVIGDDDQTIYEWRGAQPQFILDFAQTYQATTYLIDENFRSPAIPLALANNVIAHNINRQPKQLNLTRGFGGKTAVYQDNNMQAMSSHIADKIKKLHGAGVALDAMAVLVRLNAQTPTLEQELIKRKIPYHVSKPFYERQEIETLIDYGRLAWIENHIQDKGILSPPIRTQAVESWQAVCNRPKRYLSNKLRQQVAHTIQNIDLPLSEILFNLSQFVEEAWLQEGLVKLADTLHWLAVNLDKPAFKVLTKLESRLNYRDYLLTASGAEHTGLGRVATVDAFISYGRNQGSFLDLMTHIRDLATQKTQQEKNAKAVQLLTIHKAKGLEWPIVFVPQCNQNIFPFKGKETDNLEEERRLFYVALTRTKQELHIHYLKNEPISPFLQESRWHTVSKNERTLQKILNKPVSTWLAQDALTLAQQIKMGGYGRYFQNWWDCPPTKQRQIAHTMQKFYTAVVHQQLQAHLKIEAAENDLWQQISPLPADIVVTDFPGLAKLLPRKIKPKKENQTNMSAWIKTKLAAHKASRASKNTAISSINDPNALKTRLDKIRAIQTTNRQAADRRFG